MRRATSLTDAPGANASATIARFCSSLHRRRRSGPDITSTRLIAPSFAPVQNTSLAPVPERAVSLPRAQGGRYRTVTRGTTVTRVHWTVGRIGAEQHNLPLRRAAAGYLGACHRGRVMSGPDGLTAH